MSTVPRITPMALLCKESCYFRSDLTCALWYFLPSQLLHIYVEGPSYQRQSFSKNRLKKLMRYRFEMTTLMAWVHIIGPPSHWSPISLVPHLIGPPSHWSPISLVPQLAPRHHQFHWSPISLVPPTHWSPISLVPHLIGPLLNCPPIHKSPTTLFKLIGPPSHWSAFSLVHAFTANPNGPPSHWPPISLVPHPIGPLLIGSPIHKSPTTLFELIGPPFHWSPSSLIHPFSANPNGPPSHWSPSHWSPNVTLVIRLSLVPHLIGPPG